MSYELDSTIVLTFDEKTRLCVRHEDRWWGKPVTLNWAHGVAKRLHGAAFVALFARS